MSDEEQVQNEPEILEDPIVIDSDSASDSDSSALDTPSDSDYDSASTETPLDEIFGSKPVTNAEELAKWREEFIRENRRRRRYRKKILQAYHERTLMMKNAREQRAKLLQALIDRIKK